MSITLRSYNKSRDYERIGQLLIDTYRPGTRHENWPQPRWEYMHYHPLLKELGESVLTNIGVWESDGSIVAVTHFEHALGEVYFQIHPDFTHLKLEMLEYAEVRLSAEADNRHRYLKVFINDFDTELESIVSGLGYRKIEGVRECWSASKIAHPFPVISLPAGFVLKSLQDDNDLGKLDRVLHRGFNHPGEPPAGGIEDRKKMQSAPNYRKDLNIVVEAPDGSLASYCGMWYEARNRFAYVEPVCTDPDYRRKGVGTAAVLEGIRRCGEEGATIALVGSEQPFYLEMGFEKLFYIPLWAKQLAV